MNYLLLELVHNKCDGTCSYRRTVETVSSPIQGNIDVIVVTVCSNRKNKTIIPVMSANKRCRRSLISSSSWITRSSSPEEEEIRESFESICETLNSVAGCGLFDASVFSSDDAQATARLLLEVMIDRFQISQADRGFINASKRL